MMFGEKTEWTTRKFYYYGTGGFHIQSITNGQDN